METQSDKTRHAAVGPDEWDGPSKNPLCLSERDSFSGLMDRGGIVLAKYVGITAKEQQMQPYI